MQAALKLMIAGAVALSIALPASAQQVGRPVGPKDVQADEYLPNEYLDPNLLAIQVRRAEDRILALEQTNEKLVKGYNDLAAKYNQLLEYVQQTGKSR
jgi:hypothetical protein